MKGIIMKLRVSLWAMTILVGMMVIFTACGGGGGKAGGGGGGGGGGISYHYEGFPTNGTGPGDFYYIDVTMHGNWGNYSWWNVGAGMGNDYDNGYIYGAYAYLYIPNLYQLYSNNSKVPGYMLQLPNQIWVGCLENCVDNPNLIVAVNSEVSPFDAGIKEDYNFLSVDKTYGAFTITPNPLDGTTGQLSGTRGTFGGEKPGDFSATYAFNSDTDSLLFAETAPNDGGLFYSWYLNLNNLVTVMDEYTVDSTDSPNLHAYGNFMVGVKKIGPPIFPNDPNLYKGVWTFLQSNGQFGTLNVNAFSGANPTSVRVAYVDPSDGSTTGWDMTSIVNNEDGTLDIADFYGDGSNTKARAMVLPNYITVISAEDGTFMVAIRHHDYWLPTSTTDPVPSARDSHAAVWTGTEMIVWGGEDYDVLF